MDIKELKNLIKKSTAVLVLDDGDPSMVILEYKAYQELVSEKEEKDVKINYNNAMETANGGFHSIGNGVRHKESELLDRLNREILALKNQIEIEEKGVAGQGVD
jgi:hypothetical protein